MKAFDTDVLTDVLAGRPEYRVRVAADPNAVFAVPVVVVTEEARGWLEKIRDAEAGVGKMTVSQYFARFDAGLRTVFRLPTLEYSDTADAQYKFWRAAKVRIGSNDLRIAAICTATGYTLVTRNKKDFAKIPGFVFELWP